MIIKGKNLADIARQLGVSRQMIANKRKRYPQNFWIEDDCVYCFNEDGIPIGRPISSINYDPKSTADFITRKEYCQKYNITPRVLYRLIKIGALATSQDGYLVSDIDRTAMTKLNSFGRLPKTVNYDENYDCDFITRKEYHKKYNKLYSSIGYYITKGLLHTDKYGRLVEDKNV